MRLITVLPLAATAAAFVIPDARILEQLALANEDAHPVDAATAWWEHASESIEHFAHDVTDSVGHSIDSALESIHDAVVEDVDEEAWLSGHGHGDPTKSIYELISESKHTTNFSKLVDEYDDIKALLQDTKANHTLFVPTDHAFAHLPAHKKPPKEFVLAVLKYHVLPGLYPAGRVLGSHTLATELTLADLNDKAQRLRVSVGLGGVRLNFYSRVVATDFVASNGIVHAVDHILVPPPRQARLLRAFPGKFSTLELALQTTGLADELEDAPRAGGTVFAPTNFAFRRLGPRANAFLFSEHGKKYLRAILLYHVVANETLYSDAYYPVAAPDAVPKESRHVDLPSLLEGKSIAVDTRRWGPLIVMRVNGFVRVVVQDGIADDGVIQVVNRVLIPPHKHKKSEGQDWDADISVEELVERLADYVDEPQQAVGDL